MQFLSKILATSLLASLTFFNATAQAEAPATTTAPNSISSPKHSYPLLYTLNAQYAVLAKSVNGYHITLHDVAQTVVYKNSADKTGTVSIQQFVKHLQGQSVLVKADVTGVQTDNKTIGQTTFYASFTLSKPVLSTQDNILRFEATPLNSKDISINKTARFNNATVFLNGCSICVCSKTHENCVG